MSDTIALRKDEMAINPRTIKSTTGRYFPNVSTDLLPLGDTEEYVRQTVEGILCDCPPRLPWPELDSKGRHLRGLFLGPTALAYFFLLLSEKQPDSKFNGEIPIKWCQLYLGLDQRTLPASFDASCGITNEYLAYNTVFACAYDDKESAIRVITSLQSLETDPSYYEWLNGRSGALYLLRVLRKYGPSLAEEIQRTMRILIEAILSQDPWLWGERQYLGTVHGDIGILTQIILSDTYYAPGLESKLLSLLNLQQENGNWPVIPTKDVGLVHFCHGATGFVISLLAIREYFPSLHTHMDHAVEMGRELIWEKGLLRKEPNICHGIVGNALALEGNQRAHFLEYATPQKIEKGVEAGTFVKEDGGKFELLWGAAGRAWVWMNWQAAKGRVVPFTDV